MCIADLANGVDDMRMINHAQRISTQQQRRGSLDEIPFVLASELRCADNSDQRLLQSHLTICRHTPAVYRPYADHP